QRDLGSVGPTRSAFPLTEQRQLLVVGKLAVPEQVGDLFEAARGREVLDGVAAVGQGVGLRDDLGDGGGVDDDTGQALVDAGLVVFDGAHSTTPNWLYSA